MHRYRLPVFIFGLFACASTPPRITPAPAPAFPASRLPASVVDPDSILRTLSPRDRIAQLVMPWMAGTYAAQDETGFKRVRMWVDSLHVGGVLVSIGSPLDIAARLNGLQAAAPLPLLVGSDLEAGTAIRFVGGTPFPSNMGVGADGAVNDAYEMGRITAIEGRAVGIHMTFSPVADVNNNPANPIINTRSFGEDPAKVAELVAAEVRGIEANGMLAVAKHFPGHGNTGTDSHLNLPAIQAGWAQLDSLELVPFRAAIRAGATGIMSAHIALPGILGAGAPPATLSPAILTGILRDSLRFDGLVLTDALDMGAIVSAFGQGEAAVLAVLAGADILLQPVDPATTIAALEAAVQSGRISPQRIDQSARRILALKARLGLFTRREVDLDSVTAAVGREPSLAFARAVARRAIVLASDSAGTVDSLRARRRSLALVVYADNANATAGPALAAQLRARGDTVSYFKLTPTSGPASYDSARVVLASQPYAVVAAAVRPLAFRGTIALPDPLAAMVDSVAVVRRLVLASMGSPYVVFQTPRVGSLLFAWAATTLSEAALADALVDTPITGTLPVSIPPRFRLGDGLRRGPPEATP